MTLHIHVHDSRRARDIQPKELIARLTERSEPNEFNAVIHTLIEQEKSGIITKAQLGQALKAIGDIMNRANAR